MSTLGHTYPDLLEGFCFNGLCWLIVHTIICWIGSLKPFVFLLPIDVIRLSSTCTVGGPSQSECDPAELPRAPSGAGSSIPNRWSSSHWKIHKCISLGFTFQTALNAFHSSPPPASSSSMDLLCGTGTIVVLVLLAFVGAVVCIRISQPTDYTVCT